MVLPYLKTRHFPAMSVCGVDVEVRKKNRRSLSSNDHCRAILTDIALNCYQCTSSSHLDLQRFQEGYVCKSCFREIERLSIQEKQVRELKETIESKVRKELHRYTTSESTAALNPLHTLSHSVSPRSRKRPRSAVESVSTESPDVSVSVVHL